MARLLERLVLTGALFLFTSRSLVLGGMMDSLVQCCAKGREEAAGASSCTSLQGVLAALQVLPRSKEACYYIGTVCCENALKEAECSSGIDNARGSGVCSTSRSEDYLKCCELCKTGLVVGREGEECALGSATFGSLWESAFLQCCESDQQPKNPAQTTDGEITRNMCELLPGELCAHGCEPAGQSYRCYCRPGYTLMSDGKSCSPSRRCDKCSHSCEERAAGVVCTCPSGFSLASDNSTCIEGDSPTPKWECPTGFRHKFDNSNLCHDINECSEGLSTCNPSTERCKNTIGSFTCVQVAPNIKCSRGHHYSDLHQACIDTNECDETDDPPCDSNQDCKNTVGSFVCVCKSGFKQDPITHACIDVNECQQRVHNCGEFQRCDNTLGSYVCVRDINCGTGYTLNSYNSKCEDDDECALGTHTCGVLGAGWECKNTQGSFRCLRTSTTTPRPHQCEEPGPNCRPIMRACPVGYKFSGTDCVDIDECAEGFARCKSGQKCVNIRGNYLCAEHQTCKPGFRLDEERNQCIDINECKEEEGICMHHCINRWGSYRCTCKSGFNLAPDKRTCLDVNECELKPRCQGFCQNELGSYSCQCPPGYRIGRNRHSCIDINECEEKDNLCDKDSEICVNVHGSYRCGSITCPPDYIRDPARKSRCLKQINCHSWDDEDCFRQPAICSFNFITIVSNHTLPSEGYLNLFIIESSLGAASPNYSFELKQVRAPPGIEPATRAYFNLNKQYGRATIQLLKPILGPQDIHLELTTEFLIRNKITGISIHNVELYVTEHPF